MICDAHCHVIDHDKWPEILRDSGSDSISNSGSEPEQSRPDQMVVMSTGLHNIAAMCEIAEKMSQRNNQRNNKKPRIIPSFGYHPWFSHLVYVDVDNQPVKLKVDKASHYKSILYPEPDDTIISMLPDPVSMDEYCAKMERALQAYPEAIVGELGLDKPFRLRDPLSKDNNLTQYRVKLDHQVKVLVKQLRLADKYRRPISLHGVQCHGLLYQEVTKFKHIPKVCLHSYSGSVDQLKMWLTKYQSAKTFVSFSYMISLANRDKAKALLQVLPEQNLLTESDAEQASLDTIYQHNVESLKFFADNKGWTLQVAEDMISANFQDYTGAIS